jgi:hypothetical protein
MSSRPCQPGWAAKPDVSLSVQTDADGYTAGESGPVTAVAHAEDVLHRAEPAVIVVDGVGVGVGAGLNERADQTLPVSPPGVTSGIDAGTGSAGVSGPGSHGAGEPGGELPHLEVAFSPQQDQQPGPHRDLGQPAAKEHHAGTGEQQPAVD